MSGKEQVLHLADDIGFPLGKDVVVGKIIRCKDGSDHIAGEYREKHQ